jgi:hypothetical protein
MAHSETGEDDQRRFDDVIRRALATPTISSEDILKRSKESRGKWGQRK